MSSDTAFVSGQMAVMSEGSQHTAASSNMGVVKLHIYMPS